MCWLCSPVRPSALPEESPAKRVDWLPYTYTFDGVVGYQANEQAEWEDLDQWPDWSEKDPSGENFFLKIDLVLFSEKNRLFAEWLQHGLVAGGRWVRRDDLTHLREGQDINDMLEKCLKNPDLLERFRKIYK